MDILNQIKTNTYTQNIIYLSNMDVKDEIINNLSENLFFEFTKTVDMELVKQLLEENGIKLILKNKYSAELLKQLLYLGTDMQKYLINNNEFLKYVIESDFFDFYQFDSGVLDDLFKPENFFKMAVVNKDLVSYFASTLSRDTLEYYFKNSKYTNILEDYLQGDLLDIIESGANLYDKLTNELIIRISSNLDFTYYRKLERNLEKRNDITKLKQKRSEFSEKLFYSYDETNNTFKIIEDFYNELISGKNFFEVISNNKDYLSMFGTDAISCEILTVTNEKNNEQLKEILKNYSKKMLMNIICDIHYQDTHHNVYMNIYELLNYELNSNTYNLSDDKKNIYESFLNLDKMDYKQLSDFHKMLLEKNLSEELYFDIRSAKDLAYSSIISNMINDENKEKIKNENLSEIHDCDIYCLDGIKFTALVKSFVVMLNEDLEENFKTTVDGASFSLIGNDNLYTYKDPNEYYNVVYTDFSPQNIAHMFYADSYSLYEHESNMQGDDVSDRLNVICDCLEFLKKCSGYNELVIAQKNDENDKYEIIKTNPKPGFILCYDTFTENIIKTAKKLNLGVLVVNTKKYKKNRNKKGLTTKDVDPYDNENLLIYSNKNM